MEPKAPVCKQLRGLARSETGQSVNLDSDSKQCRGLARSETGQSTNLDLASPRLLPWRGWLMAALLAAPLLLAACQHPIDDPYSAGQQFRQLVDALVRDASEFMAGFCGLTPAAILALLLALLLGKRPS